MEKIGRALEAVDQDLELSVTNRFSKLHSIMSLVVDIYISINQEEPRNRSVQSSSYLKRQRSIAWHNYRDLRPRKGRSSEIALIFYNLNNYQYKNYPINHEIQEDLNLINKFSEHSKFLYSQQKSQTTFSRAVEVEQVVEWLPKFFSGGA